MSYVSLQKSQLLDSLENQVLYADLCSLVIGEQGIGKSYFLEQLNVRLEGQVNLSQLEALNEMSVAQLEKSISLQLGLSWSESDNLIQRVADRFDRRVLITIDNAHQLPLTCLEYLMMLVEEQLAARETHVFLVLAGDASLAKKLNQTSALSNNPNICVVFELQPIEQSETKHLVADFQSVDVGTAEALYDEQKLEYFWQLSKGKPGELQYQLNRWLSESSVKKELPEETSNTRKYTLAAAYSVIAFSLILVLIYQDDINRLIEGSSESHISTASESGSSTAKQSYLKANSQSSDDENSDLMEDSTSEPELTKQPDSVVSQAPQNNDATSQEGLTEEVEISQPSESQAKESAISQTLESEPLPQSEDQPVDSAPPESQQVSIEDKPTDKVEQSNPKIIPSDKTLPANTAELANNNNLSADESRLMSMDDKLFTLQWVGVSSIAAAEKFRSGHPLKKQMLIFRRKQSTGFLYLVVSGQFLSRIDADHSRIIYQRRKYPGKPWIKTISAVKKDISSLR